MDHYDKLVRDGIPAVIESNGEEPVTHVADGAEYRERLHDKLDEEVAEFHDDPCADELADVRGVLAALREHHGITEEAVAERRAQKASERGRFDDGVVLVFAVVAVPGSSGGSHDTIVSPINESQMEEWKTVQYFETLSSEAQEVFLEAKDDPGEWVTVTGVDEPPEFAYGGAFWYTYIYYEGEYYGLVTIG